MQNARTLLSKDLSKDCTVTRVLANGDMQKLDLEIPVEHVVNVFVNGQRAMVLTCTGSHVEELVLGRLFTEGLIENANDVESISFAQDASDACVILKDHDKGFDEYSGEQVDTCGAGTRNLVKRWVRIEDMPRCQTTTVRPEQIFCMARMFAEDTPLHTSTLGVHSCSLYDGCAQLYCFEDMGRHNAFDKVVGGALLDGIEMDGLAVFSSGRVPMDMVTKAIRSGISMLVTKATPSTRSVALASKSGLALVGRARPDSFYVFSGAVEA